MDCEEGNAIMSLKLTRQWDVPVPVPVPRRPRSWPLRCKRNLVFDDTYLISKRIRADIVIVGLESTTVAAQGSSVYKCLKNLPSPRSLKNEESKEEECIDKTAVVGPQTPLPAIRKGGSSLTNKISHSNTKAVIRVEKDKLQQVSELAEKSVYFTRSISHKVSNAFELVQGRGKRVSQEGNKKLYPKTTKETTRAWRKLLKKAIDQSCGSVEDEILQVFHQKAQLFVSKVGTVQGERVYFPWKGSVLDSVIGAFLTQRVGDNFSSSAFMSLGVSFPQSLDCSTYSRHHRILRERRSIGDHCCQNQDTKGTIKRKSSVVNIKPDWNTLRTQYSGNSQGERSTDGIDYVDWHAVRRADVEDISNAIKLRGMNNKLAKRIKEFLDRLMMDHGNLDLEWMRNVPPPRAREFLLSIFGLGMKSAQCVQLLTLKQPAFPVDVNVARVTARLGWVPAPPDTSDELQMTVLEESSMLHNLINQYLLPRLCKLDHKTLYELHYHMITFGKVFCTKQKPSCAECPMRKDCKYYADIDIENFGGVDGAKTQKKSTMFKSRNEKQKGVENDHDYSHKGDVEAPKTPLKNQSLLKMRRQGQKHTKVSSSTGRQPKKSRTRTQHYVYELHDCHPILEKFDDRDPDDLSPYLLITWESGDPLGNSMPSSSLSHVTRSQTVPGTVLIPYRTALRGSFPLNATYFQINEVFADQETSRMPIDVRCKTLEQLPRKTLYCGSDLFNIVKGLTADEVKSLFTGGYICTRGFDRETLAPVTLERRLHMSSQSKNKKRNQ